MALSYLRSLGFSETLTALVWLAGPLAGAILQQIVGACSERCTSCWRRRKPYIVAGVWGTILCLLGLAYVQRTCSFVLALLQFNVNNGAFHIVMLGAAHLWVYTLNSAIQPVQSGIRTFIIDQCPAHQQVEARGWASRLLQPAAFWRISLGHKIFQSIYR